MTARRDLARTVYEADRDIDALFRPLVPRIGGAVRDHAEGGVITNATSMAVLRDVDAILDDAGFPTRRGASSPLQTLIETRANAARLLVIAEAVETMRRHVPDEVLTAMGDTDG
jgi:hypothetical protein